MGGDRFCALRQQDGATLPPLLPGWVLEALYLGCTQVPWLKLKHEDGRVADWFLNRNGRLVANVFEGLKARERGWLADHVRELLALSPGPYRDEALAAYRTMNPAIRVVLESMPEPPAHVISGEQARLLLLATQALAGTTSLSDREWQLEPVRPDGDLDRSLHQGWKVENGQAWAVGPSSDITLTGLVPMGRHQLRLSLRDCASSMLLWVWANGRLISATQIDNRWRHEVTTLSFWIPPECVVGDRLDVSLRLDRAPRAEKNYALHALRLFSSGDMLPVPLEDKDVLVQFEGIGDNCQFGNVQRHFGIEPLGLLRFAGVRDLVRLFESRFKGLDRPGSLQAYLAGSEYQIRDHDYGLFYHTFRYDNEISHEDVVVENETKIRYLIRKLIEDLEDGEKIFVYRRFVESDLATIAELHRVLRSYGPVKMLWVTQGTIGRAPGDVEWAGPNLLRGYVAEGASNDPSTFNPGHWIRLLRNASAAFQRIASVPT